MTLYSFAILLSRLGTSALFHFWFWLFASWPAYRFHRRQPCASPNVQVRINTISITLLKPLHAQTFFSALFKYGNVIQFWEEVFKGPLRALGKLLNLLKRDTKKRLFYYSGRRCMRKWYLEWRSPSFSTKMTK